MHELALMGDVLQLVSEDARKRGISRITRIDLIVGELSNALPDALEMAFAMFKAQGMELFPSEAELVIHREEAKARCILCEKVYKPERRLAVCPDCAMPSGRVITGETFAIQSYEGS